MTTARKPPGRSRVVDGKHLRAVAEASEAARLLEEQNEQVIEAVRMRREGFSWWDIAEEVKLPEQQISQLVHQKLAGAAALVDTGVKRELLVLEVLRLDDLQRAVWPKAMAGNSLAVKSALDIIKMRSTLLGLGEADAAATAERTVIISAPNEQDYIAGLRALAQAAHRDGSQEATG